MQRLAGSPIVAARRPFRLVADLERALDSCVVVSSAPCGSTGTSPEGVATVVRAPLFDVDGPPDSSSALLRRLFAGGGAPPFPMEADLRVERPARFMAPCSPTFDLDLGGIFRVGETDFLCLLWPGLVEPSLDFLRPGRGSSAPKSCPKDFVFLNALREECRSFPPAAPVPVSPTPPPNATDLRIPRRERSALVVSFWLLPRDNGSRAVVDRSAVVEAAVVTVLAVMDTLSVLFSLVDMSPRAEVVLRDSLTDVRRDLDRSLFS